MIIEDMQQSLELLENIKYFFYNTEEIEKKLNSDLRNKEYERDDLLHEIELSKLNAIEIMAVYKKLEKVLQERRIIKDKIDLVKKGDYVNGHLIVKIRIDPFNNKKQLFTEHWDYNWQGDGTLLVLYDEDIKNILTHEQYLENCFEVMQE